jgi:transposase
MLASPPILGTIRSILCPLCSERNKKPMRRQHEYGEIRAERHLERFWECTACGHKIPADSASIY